MDMQHFRAIMVRRLDPADAPEVARIFAEHDLTDLPHRLGLTRRTLFRLEDLYLHLIEGGPDLPARLTALRDDPLFVEVDARLAPLLRPYSRGTSSMTTSSAEPFYTWTPHR